jgi:isocitrate dehydrogenase
VFDEIRVEYPEIASDHMIIDIGTAHLATRPERFDVIVTPNLYGDIISDVAAELTGSVGLGGSANIGEHVAMFEAIHGSAPDIAGRDMANPSGLLLGAVMMLVHIGQSAAAERIHNALLKTIEDGVHTADLHTESGGAAVGTQAFADAVIARLGQEPSHLACVRYSGAASKVAPPAALSAPRPAPARAAEKKALVGVDVFVHARSTLPDDLARRMQEASEQLAPIGFKLQMLTNRGVKVWPGGFPETFCTDHWRCRFMGTSADGQPETISHTRIIRLLQALASAEIDFIKTENLCTFSGEPGFALGQGQ